MTRTSCSVGPRLPPPVSLIRGRSISYPMLIFERSVHPAAPPALVLTPCPLRSRPPVLLRALDLAPRSSDISAQSAALSSAQSFPCFYLRRLALCSRLVHLSVLISSQLWPYFSLRAWPSPPSRGGSSSCTSSSWTHFARAQLKSREHRASPHSPASHLPLYPIPYRGHDEAP